MSVTREDFYRLSNGTALPGMHPDVVIESANELLFLLNWQLTPAQMDAFHDAYALSLNGFRARQTRREKQERVRREVGRQWAEVPE